MPWIRKHVSTQRSKLYLRKLLEIAITMIEAGNSSYLNVEFNFRPEGDIKREKSSVIVIGSSEFFNPSRKTVTRIFCFDSELLILNKNIQYPIIDLT